MHDEDLKLIRQIVASDGRKYTAGNIDRSKYDRLVDMGWLTPFKTNVSDVEYQPTDEGRASASSRWAEGEEVTRIPGGPPQPISKAERAARKALRELDAEMAMTEHEIAQKAFPVNRERLKAERLAREAAGTPSATKKVKPSKKTK